MIFNIKMINMYILSTGQHHHSISLKHLPSVLHIKKYIIIHNILFHTYTISFHNQSVYKKTKKMFFSTTINNKRLHLCLLGK